MTTIVEITIIETGIEETETGIMTGNVVAKRQQTKDEDDLLTTKFLTYFHKVFS